MNWADWNANVNSAWCILAAYGAMVLAWKAYQFVKHEGLKRSALRVQLCLALSLVLFGDSFRQLIAWIFWQARVRDGLAPWPQGFVMLGQIGGLFAVVGVTVAIRAMTREDYGNWVWLAALACAAVVVVAF